MYDRIMYGLSAMDVMNSLNLVLAPFMLPVGTPGATMAKGNNATCQLHGFLVTAGMSVLFYNASLSMYFLLLIYGGATVKLQKYEIYFHFVPIIISAMLGLIGFSLKLYHPNPRRCWISPNPYNCLDNENEIECVSGEHALQWAWYISGIWVALVFLFMIISNFLIYFKFKKVEESRAGETLFLKTQFVAFTARLYLFAYLLTVIWPYVQVNYTMITGHNVFALDILILIFYPIQGVFNYMIFKWRRQLGVYLEFCQWNDDEDEASSPRSTYHNENDVKEMERGLRILSSNTGDGGSDV